MIYHITPINDLKEHEESSVCPCDPTIKTIITGDVLCIHNAYDGREGVEWANEILNIAGDRPLNHPFR